MEAAGRSFTCTILRPSTVFGCDMPNRSLFEMITMIAHRVFFFIGRPGASANYVHVDNVVWALMLCAQRPKAAKQVYNLSDYRTVEDFVSAVSRFLGVKAPRMRLPERPVRIAAKLPGRVHSFPLKESRVDALTTRVTYPTDRIEGELGYAHRVSMEDGLHELVDAWKRSR